VGKWINNLRDMSAEKGQVDRSDCVKGRGEMSCGSVDIADDLRRILIEKYKKFHSETAKAGGGCGGPRSDSKAKLGRKTADSPVTPDILHTATNDQSEKAQWTQNVFGRNKNFYDKYIKNGIQAKIDSKINAIKDVRPSRSQPKAPGFLIEESDTLQSKIFATATEQLSSSAKKDFQTSGNNSSTHLKTSKSTCQLLGEPQNYKNASLTDQKSFYG
jgi:hypothetical protein